MTISTQAKNNGTRTGMLLAITLLLAMAVPVFAQEMKVPETAKDHHEMAEHYQKVAAQTRGDIEMHKKMLADFNEGAVKSPKTGENPYSKKMRLHCDKYIKVSEALATEADSSAAFHNLRAKELEGK
jgi:hypothetical protein